MCGTTRSARPSTAASRPRDARGVAPRRAGLVGVGLRGGGSRRGGFATSGAALARAAGTPPRAPRRSRPSRPSASSGPPARRTAPPRALRRGRPAPLRARRRRRRGVPHHRPRGGGGAVHLPDFFPDFNDTPRGAAGRRRSAAGTVSESAPEDRRAGRHVRVEAGVLAERASDPPEVIRALRGTRGGFFRRRFFGLIIIISLGPGLRRVVVRLPRTRSPPPGRHPRRGGGRSTPRRRAIRRRVRGAVRPDRVLPRRQLGSRRAGDDPAEPPPEVAARRETYARTRTTRGRSERGA